VRRLGGPVATGDHPTPRLERCRVSIRLGGAASCHRTRVLPLFRQLGRLRYRGVPGSGPGLAIPATPRRPARPGGPGAPRPRSPPRRSGAVLISATSGARVGTKGLRTVWSWLFATRSIATARDEHGTAYRCLATSGRRTPRRTACVTRMQWPPVRSCGARSCDAASVRFSGDLMSSAVPESAPK
jgi:hypothetical protein